MVKPGQLPRSAYVTMMSVYGYLYLNDYLEHARSMFVSSVGSMKTNPKISRYSIMRLDWIAILDEAIKARPTSWWVGKTSPVREWRNASDEVCFAVINAMEKAGLLIEE